MAELTKEQRYAVEITSVVGTLFDEDSENYRYNIDEIDATAFFTGFAMAFRLTFNRLTGGDEDFIGSTHLANRLALQYLIREGRTIE